MRTRLLMLAAVTLAALLISAETATAAQVCACKKNTNGRVRRITAGAPPTCRPSQTLVCWDEGGTAMPTGTVMAFDLPSCPLGWSPYALAVGRVVVGGGTVGVTHTGAGGTGTLADGAANTLTQVPYHQHFTRINTADSNPHQYDPIPAGADTFTVLGQDNSCVYFSEATESPQKTGYEDPPSGAAVPSCFTGTYGGVDVAMPYVQLLYCRKD